MCATTRHAYYASTTFEEADAIPRAQRKSKDKSMEGTGWRERRTALSMTFSRSTWKVT